MALDGHATPDGTRRYGDRVVAAGIAHPEHFREGVGGLSLSSIGLGTYLGGCDARTDGAYEEAVKAAVAGGCNVFDSAINYRCQRSERVLGQAMAGLVHQGRLRRDEVIIATKGGYLPCDGSPPVDSAAYLLKTFITPGIMGMADLVAECHCMTPSYLRHQLETSLCNLCVSCVDLYYVHNPEIQLDAVTGDEFLARIGGAFQILEEAVAEKMIRVYGTATWMGFRRPPGSRGHLSLETLVNIAAEVGGKDHHFRVVQVPYNLAMPEALAEQTQALNGRRVSLLEAAKALDVYVMSSASMLQGRLTRGLPGEVQFVLGAESDAQRAIQFARSTPGVGTALVGMKQTAHVRENLAVSKLAPLAPDQFVKLFK